LSSAGPLVEYSKAHKLKNNAKQAGYEEDALSVLYNIVVEREPLLETNPNPAPPLQEKGALLEEVSHEKGTKKHPNVKISCAVVPNKIIEDIVNSSQRQVQKASAWTMRMVASMIFWAVMSCLPFIVDIKCGKPVPATSHMIFFGTAVNLSVLELWITIQTCKGYLLFKNLKSKFLLGIALGFAGRFDTHSDVIFAKMINDCEPITWFSIWEHYFYLPLPLGQLVVGILTLGVYLCQALPGLILLSSTSINSDS